MLARLLSHGATVTLILLFLPSCVGPIPHRSPPEVFEVVDADSLELLIELESEELRGRLTRWIEDKHSKANPGDLQFVDGMYDMHFDVRAQEENTSILKVSARRKEGGLTPPNFLGDWTRRLIKEITE